MPLLQEDDIQSLGSNIIEWLHRVCHLRKLNISQTLFSSEQRAYLESTYKILAHNPDNLPRLFALIYRCTQKILSNGDPQAISCPNEVLPTYISQAYALASKQPATEEARILIYVRAKIAHASWRELGKFGVVRINIPPFDRLAVEYYQRHAKTHFFLFRTAFYGKTKKDVMERTLPTPSATMAIQAFQTYEEYYGVQDDVHKKVEQFASPLVYSAFLEKNIKPIYQSVKNLLQQGMCYGSEQCLLYYYLMIRAIRNHSDSLSIEPLAAREFNRLIAYASNIDPYLGNLIAADYYLKNGDPQAGSAAIDEALQRQSSRQLRSEDELELLPSGISTLSQYKEYIDDQLQCTTTLNAT